MHAILYTDGGSRGNPGKSACSFVLKDSSSKIIIAKGKFLGISTNNVAEYQGLIMGLENAIENKIKSLTCYLDSELVVKQVKGEYKVKNENLKNFYIKVLNLNKEFEQISFFHVSREKNNQADEIVNKVLDTN